MAGSAVSVRLRGSSLTSCAWRMACSRSTGTSSRTRPPASSRAAACRCSATSSRLDRGADVRARISNQTSDLHLQVFPVGFSDLAPKYFPERGHRHLVAEIDPFRNLEAGQERLAVRDELGFFDRTARLQFDGCDDDLA